MTTADPSRSAARGTAFTNAVWLLLAGLACVSVLLLNGRPLFYFDTVGYVDQGEVALAQVHLIAPPEKSPAADASDAATDGGATGGAAVRTVDGSRSASYSVLAAIFSQVGVLEGLLVVNGVALFLTVGLMARLAVRMAAPQGQPARMAAFGLLAASAGSLPFYFAYLMPDLLAPVLILSIALLTAFGAHMRPGELVLAFCLGAFGIISHLSHFAIAGLMLLAALPLSLVLTRRRWWIGPLVIVALLGVAYAQQKALRLVARSAAHSEVIIRPYITARLIQDGPGLVYLQSHCPDAAIPTCKLFEALSWSDDPYRLTASHIVFERSKQLGSFRLMTPEDQKIVAQAQVGFLLAVLKANPVRTMTAFLHNSLLQSSMISVDMTLPSDKMVASNASVTGALSGPLVRGRLGDGDGWLAPLVRLQGGLYVAALAAVLVLLALPGSLPARVKIFAIMVLLGILANAFVCGGISQPATRYGARVIWLLPLMAAVLLYLAQVGERYSNGEAVR